MDILQERKQCNMAYFPMFVDLTDKTCLVVGGGEVAYRKVKTLLDFDAKVTVVAESVCPRLAGLAGAPDKKILSACDYVTGAGEVTSEDKVQSACGQDAEKADALEQERKRVQAILDQEKQKLVKLEQAVKVVEKHKEKQKEAYQEEQKAIELKQFSEIGVQRFFIRSREEAEEQEMLEQLNKLENE